MGAYNWLKATIQCFRCGYEKESTLQIQIGWCRYQGYSIGERITWMMHEDRIRAEKLMRDPDSVLPRTFVEVGSPDLKDFAISAGDYQCPRCHARGTLLAIVRDNVFQSVLFVSTSVAYGQILLPPLLGEFLQGGTFC